MWIFSYTIRRHCRYKQTNDSQYSEREVMSYLDTIKLEELMIEELEGVFRCDEHTEDELLQKYDDLYKRVSRIVKGK
tara:strand:+ start:33 stop:263 length:231 start_codon:yes stop_codon:yes gene_type:complete